MYKRMAIIVVLALLFLLLVNIMVMAQGLQQGDAIRGGLLYDNWFVVLDLLPPEGNQPLWDEQTTNQRSGTITWRCVSCHSWDYKGADGAYGPNSPEYTGFNGIQSMVGATGKQIVAWLDGSNNPDHDFSGVINRHAVADLIAFIRTKQIDLALLIDYNDRSALGRQGSGAKFYNESCLPCHGIDGSGLNFDTAKNPEFIGDVALSDPWRFLHRVRFGTPIVMNHSFEAAGWSLQDIVDTLAYAQTLPAADPEAGEIVETDPDEFLDYAEQGQMNTINIAALIIVLVIFVSQVWTAYLARS